MILVTIGTYEAPFDRLLEAVAPLAQEEELTIQVGRSTVRPEGAQCFDYAPFDVMRELVRKADTVVSHAGAGTVLLALAERKRPFVVPRLARYGEVVDDHQVPFARRLDGAGLVTLVEDPADLVAAIKARTSAGPVEAPGGGASLKREIAASLAEVLRRDVPAEPAVAR
jgi:UDP-N-acetylglucosamine transferase subunit ALG13